MAEFVEVLTEKTVEQLDQLRHIGLLSESEAKDVIKSRQNNEYRLARKEKRIQDYLNYIQFEINFLEMIRLRRQKRQNFGRHQLDIEQINRIHSLFRSCTGRFQNDADVWLSHIDFAKKHRQAGYVGRLYKRMLQIHSHRSDLWMDAAVWEIEMNNADTARKVFLTALRFNHDDKKLWIAYQRFELQQAVTARRFVEEEKLKEKSEIETAEATKEPEFPEAVTDGRLAALAFKKGVEALPNDDKFIVELLEAWTELVSCDLANQCVDELFSLVRADAQHPELAAACCRKPLVGALPGCQLEAVRESIRCFDLKLNEDDCCSTSASFQSLYVKFLLEQVNKVAPKLASAETPNPERSFFLSKTKTLVENRIEKGIKLEEAVIADSIDLLLAEKCKVSLKVAQTSVNWYPKSKKLWLLLFEMLCSSEHRKSKSDYIPLVEQSFSAPFPDTLQGQADSLTVWHAALQLCVLSRLPYERLDAIWQQAASLHLKELGPSYLEWAYHSCAMAPSPWKATERAFAKVSVITTKRPLPVELHLCRLRLALSIYEACRFSIEDGVGVEVDSTGLRKLIDTALLDVGNNCLDLWLLLVRFECEYGDVESLAHSAWRARRALSPKALADFNAFYAQITASPSSAQLPAKVRKTT